MTRITDAAEVAAKQYGVDVADVVALMPDAYAQLQAERELTEPARIRACYLTGLNARRCNSWEDSGFDHSTRPRFDCHARTVAWEHPELGLDPHNTDTPPAIWELIKRGPLQRLAKSSAEVADLAAQWAMRFNVHYDEFTDWTDDDLDAIEPDADCDCSFNPDEFDVPVAGEVDTDPVAGESVCQTVARESLTGTATLQEVAYASSGYCLFVRTPFVFPHKRQCRRFQSVRRYSLRWSMPRLRYNPPPNLVDGSRCCVTHHCRGDPLPGKL